MKKLAIISITITALIVLVFVVIYKNDSNTKLKGRVVGDNPTNIAPERLPICNFTGAGYVSTPCFEPEGTINL